MFTLGEVKMKLRGDQESAVSAMLPSKFVSGELAIFQDVFHLFIIAGGYRYVVVRTFACGQKGT